MTRRILGAAIGSCVHIGGLQHFLSLARTEGYETRALGAAVKPDQLVDAIEQFRPDIVALSYRLTPDVAINLFREISAMLSQRNLVGLRLIFGGTAATAAVARASGLFEHVFFGEGGAAEILAFLRGDARAASVAEPADTLVARVEQKYPYPLVRHHFGLPSLRDTIEGGRQIAASGVLDVLSIGPDQNAQEHFFRPKEMNLEYYGAGGVPVRRPDDMRAIYNSTRTGNHPLLRCYGGTRDLIRWAEMSVQTIRNAWGAIPLCWYSILDGRSDVPLRAAILEKQEAMRWYAERGIPVEVNESHQWSLRDGHDALAVATAFLGAYNARQLGVRWYIAQLMLNTPPGTTIINDLAKMLAKLTLISRLESPDFMVFREIRPGIAHFSPDPDLAKGQGASSIAFGMSLHPHIVHPVSFSEGDHATTAEELIESCGIAHGAIRNALDGVFDPGSDARIIERRDQLIRDADCILEAIRTECGPANCDPWTDPNVIAAAIECGVLDTPHFQGHPLLCGRISTACIHGEWHAVDPASGRIIPEETRIMKILEMRHRDARRQPAPVRETSMAQAGG